MNASTLAQKLWTYSTALRNDGMSYGNYVEQLTYPPARNGRGIGSRSCW